MAELHSITGLFYESFPGISPWGGFILKGIHPNPDSIEGMLTDTYGSSRLAGFMDDKNLEFRKQYENCNHNLSFDYNFSLKDGLWMGEYKSTGSSYGGRSLCKTSMILKDLEFKEFDCRTTEGYVKALIDSMVDDGSLKVINDPKSKLNIIALTHYTQFSIKILTKYL